MICRTPGGRLNARRIPCPMRRRRSGATPVDNTSSRSPGILCSRTGLHRAGTTHVFQPHRCCVSATAGSSDMQRPYTCGRGRRPYSAKMVTRRNVVAGIIFGKRASLWGRCRGEPYPSPNSPTSPLPCVILLEMGGITDRDGGDNGWRWGDLRREGSRAFSGIARPPRE